MQKIKFPLFVTTLYLVIFTILSLLNISIYVMITLFVLSQILVIWMVIRVLKDGQPSDKEFSEGHWYEDSNYRARVE